MIAAIHLVAAIACLMAKPSAAVGAAVLALLGLSAALLVRRERRLADAAIVLEDSGLLGLGLHGRSSRGAPLAGCTDFGWAIWLQWRELATAGAPKRRVSALMLLPDHVEDAEHWRQLRIWLRHKCATGLSDVESS